MEAKFIKFANGQVTLERRDRQQVELPIEKLIFSDQKLIRAGGRPARF